MMNPDDFGAPIGGSRWFKGTLETRRTRVVPVRIEWPCPLQPCEGMMEQTGSAWPMNPMGWHHRCSKCGFNATPREGERFPRIEYVVESESV